MSVIYFEDQNIIEINPERLVRLKQNAIRSPLRRARYCLHRGRDDKVHEMVIAFCHNSYCRPHRHTDKSESFHIIEGEMLVVFFDDTGCVSRCLEMAPPGRDKTFFYRLNSPLWHTVLPLSECVVFHETTAGPFIPDQKDVASWAPNEGDTAAVNSFLPRIKKEIDLLEVR